MQFINNKYTLTYFNIINRASTRKSEGHVERHHIVPRSLGGSDHESNIAVLTVREHFICHKLLVKMVPSEFKRPMIKAIRSMALMDATPEKRRNGLRVTSRLFETLRQINKLPDTPETRERKRKSATGRLHSDATKIKMSETRIARYGSTKKKGPRLNTAWTLTSPSGEVHQVENLEAFAQEHELYAPALAISGRSGQPVPAPLRSRRDAAKNKANTVGWLCQKNEAQYAPYEPFRRHPELFE